MSTFLAAQGLSFSYDSSRVLNNFTLEVRQGEIFGLLGPNGSGKSTFLKLLAGLDRPASGSFSFQGETFVSPTRRFRESIGVVFQSPALDDKLTAVQNLQLAARIHGIPAQNGIRGFVRCWKTSDWRIAQPIQSGRFQEA